MHSRVFGMIGVLAGLGLAACHQDPLSDLNGTPSTLALSVASLDLTIPGGTATAVAQVLDARANPLAGQSISFQSRDASVVTVVTDPSYDPVPATSIRVTVTPVGPGETSIDFTSGGLSGSVEVTVEPVAFPGAISDTNPAGGTTITISSTSVLKFTDSSTVTFAGNSAPAPVVSTSPDALTVLVPFFAGPGPLSISNVNVTTLPGTVVTLPTVSSVRVSGDWGFSSTTPAGGDALTVTATGILAFTDSTNVRWSVQGIQAPVISRSPTAVMVLAPIGAKGLVDLTNVSYGTGLVAGQVTSSDTIAVTGDWGYSSKTPISGDTLAIAATSTLKFTDSTGVSFPNYGEAPVVSATPDTVRVLVPFGPVAGNLSITNINPLNAPGQAVTMSTVAGLLPGGDFWGTAPYDWPTAPDITGLLPAAGQVSWLIATGAPSNPAGICPEDRFQFGPVGTCVLFKFTLAAPTTVTFTTDWTGGSGDVDVLVCSDSALASYSSFTPCVDDGFSGATSAQPEIAGGVQYPAGTYWLAMQDYDGGGVTNYIVKIETQ